MGNKEIVSENVDWIHVAQNRGQWRGTLNTVMKFELHTRKIVSWPAEGT